MIFMGEPRMILPYAVVWIRYASFVLILLDAPLHSQNSFFLNFAGHSRILASIVNGLLKFRILGVDEIDP